jgi:hypothetical protein
VCGAVAERVLELVDHLACDIDRKPLEDLRIGRTDAMESLSVLLQCAAEALAQRDDSSARAGWPLGGADLRFVARSM